MVLLYGFSLLYMLSGIFAYGLNAFQVFAIALVCFAVDKFTFKSTRRFMTIMATVLVLVGSGIYLLYRMEQLAEVGLILAEFFKVYWLSITVVTVAIDTFHQVIMLLMIGLLLMAPLDLMISLSKRNYLYLMGVTILLVIVGYLTKSMGSMRDREAFLILSATMIVYYFYSFYYRYSDLRRQFLPFASTILLFVVMIVGGSRFLYSIDPRPLTQTVQEVSYVPSEDMDFEVQEKDKLNYFRSDTSYIADAFEFDYIEVLRLRSEEVSYLKSETYEFYYEGQWTKSKELPYIPGGPDKVQDSQAFESIDYNDFYSVEDVRTIVKDFNTNVLLVNNYDVLETRFYDNIQVLFDARRGTFFTNNRLEDGYVYEYSAIIPNYGSRAFDDLARAYSGETLPQELDQYRTPLSDRYGEINDLVATITEGINNKYDQALAVEKYLQENYTYNEKPPVPPANTDPILYFLFESKEGFCQQFATSYALMMRSLDIPARYTVGFYVADRDIDPIDYQDIYEQEFIDDGVYSVYDSNAHSWPEAYFPEVGWIMFEPTPGRYYKSAETDYDPYDFEDAQRAEAPGTTIVINASYVYMSMAVVLLGGLLFLIVLIIRLRYLLRRKTPSEKMLDIHQLIRHYYKLAGLKKTPNETAKEFARRVDDWMFDMKEMTLMGLMADYQGLVYGGEVLTSADLEKHILYLKALRKAMKRRLNKVYWLRMRLAEFVGVNIK